MQDQENEILIIIRFLQILKNPYKTFIYKKDFNFHKFYEQLEKSDPNELKKQI